MKIYVASSWKNELQPEVVKALRTVGHDVYDFKNPAPDNHGFHWSDVHLERDEYGQCSPLALKRALKHSIAIDGYYSDFNAMNAAHACVLVLPCGRSAHLEAGWMAGRGKPTYVLALGARIEPELMYGLLRGELLTSIEELIFKLA